MRKSVVYVIVGESHNGYVYLVQRYRANVVIFHSVWVLMLGAVYFNHQLGFVTIEIGDVVIYHMLPPEPNGVLP